MTDIVIRFDDQTELELKSIDIGVEQDVLAFDISGTIQGLDDELLKELTGSSLKPTEIQFSMINNEHH
ncbi:hypothetical protein DMJ13_20710 [halophilic archaeon]|nr:hypothetical protein DMJ13_20710 [halophilic archaeon]